MKAKSLAGFVVEQQQSTGWSSVYFAKTLADARRVAKEIKAMGYKTLITQVDSKGRRARNGMFDAKAVAGAKRVTKTPPRVVEKQTGERGEVLAVLPGGWLKVQWRNRDKPTLIKRSELKRASNPSDERDSAGNVDVIRYYVAPKPLARGWWVQGVIVNSEGREVGLHPTKWIASKTKSEAKHLVLILNKELKRLGRYQSLDQSIERRPNVEGFTDESGFHPIRASKDYNEFKTTDVASASEKRERKQARDARSISEWNREQDAKHKSAIKHATTSHSKHRASIRSLSQFVRARGGMTPGGPFAGEVRRLSAKETGTTGLINQHARQGSHKQTPEYVMDAANVAGYGPYDAIGDFILAVEEDATGMRKHYAAEDLDAMADMADNPASEPVPYFCSDCEAELTAGKSERLRDGRTVCAKCAERMRRQTESRKQRDMFTEQEQLFNPDLSPSDPIHLLALESIHYINTGRGAQFLKKAIARAEKRRNALQGAERTKATKLILLAKRQLRKDWKLSAKDNPGFLDLVAGMQAADYLLGKVKTKTNPKRGRNSSETSGDMGAGATSSDVRSPTRTSTEVRSPTKTSTVADTRGNITVTGGAGAGATTRVIVKQVGERKRNPARVKVGQVWQSVDTGNQWKVLELGGKVKVERLSIASYKGGDIYYFRYENFAPPLMRLMKTSRQTNPSPREMSERFQGTANGSVKQYYASDSAPRLDYSRAGRLIFLKVGGRQIKAPGAVVAIDPRTEKLWIASNRRGALFNKRAPGKGQALDFGEIDAICYLTAKHHIGNGKTFEYVHAFGEEGGRKPHLLIDHEGMPILRGGDYRVKSEGIVN